MNRRQLLGMMVAAPVAGAAGWKAADAVKDEVMHPTKGESYKDLYWQAQADIGELNIEPGPITLHDPGEAQYIMQTDQPQTLTYYDGTGKSAEIYFDGDKLVLKNHVTGRSFSV